jgi:hypothetical protein
VWTELIEDPEMKVIEAKLREVKEHEQQVVERDATLPLVAHVNHSSSTTGTSRSGENEGSTKDPTTETWDHCKKRQCR